MPIKQLVGILLLVFFLCISTTAQHRPFQTKIKKESWITAGLFAAGFAASSVKSNEQSYTLVQLQLLDSKEVNRFDRKAIQYWEPSLAKASDVFLYGSFLLPATLLASERIRAHWKDIGILYLQTGLTNSLVTDIIKITVDRTRPLAYNNSAELKQRLSFKARQSFVSGHTSQSAAFCYLTASVFSAYFPEAKAKRWVWVGAATYPAVVGYLRYRSGKHYPTDVIGGYLVGAAIGLLIPAIHRVDRNSEAVSLKCSPFGFNLTVGL